MSRPHRLLDASDSEIERLLLRAGRAGAPPGAQKRALVAATAVLGASMIAGTGVAAGNAALSAKVGSFAALGSLKWLALAGAVGAAGVGTVVGAVAIQHAATPMVSTTVRTRATSVRPASIARSAPPPPTQATARPVEAVPASATSSVQTPPHTASGSPIGLAPVPTTPSFSDELATLDRARAAIDVREPARALSILEGYRSRFPNGAMRPEAAMLRIEALEKAGDHPAAIRAADAFLESDPATPYAARVRSLVESPNP